MITGHILLTATTDLVIWLAVILFAMRAAGTEQTGRPRYRLAAGPVAGIGLYNRHLVIISTEHPIAPPTSTQLFTGWGIRPLATPQPVKN